MIGINNVNFVLTSANKKKHISFLILHDRINPNFSCHKISEHCPIFFLEFS